MVFFNTFYVDSRPLLADLGVPEDIFTESWKVFFRYFWGSLENDFFKFELMPNKIGEVPEIDFTEAVNYFLKGVLSNDIGMG